MRIKDFQYNSLLLDCSSCIIRLRTEDLKIQKSQHIPSGLITDFSVKKIERKNTNYVSQIYFTYFLFKISLKAEHFRHSFLNERIIEWSNNIYYDNKNRIPPPYEIFVFIAYCVVYMRNS